MRKVLSAPFFWFNPTKWKLESLGQEREGVAAERKVKYCREKADPDSTAFFHGSCNLCQPLFLLQYLKKTAKRAETCLRARAASAWERGDETSGVDQFCT